MNMTKTMWKSSVLLFANGAVVDARCSNCNGRGNNKPVILSDLKEQSNSCQVAYSDNVAADVRRGLEEGNKVTEKFIGKWGPCLSMVLEFGGTDANYQSLTTARTNWLTGMGVNPSSWVISQFSSTITQAKNSNYGAWVQGVGSCELTSSTESCERCDTVQHPYNVAGDAYYMGQSNAFDIFERATHEYTHIFQLAHGYSGVWTWEGGAVLMECIMSSLPSGYTNGVTSGNSYRACIKRNLGVYSSTATTFPNTYNYGSSPINVLQGTAPSNGKTLLEEYGERRLQCDQSGNNCNERSDWPQGGSARAYYYDIGMLATAYAVHYAGKTMTDYWRGPHSFWKNIQAKDLLNDNWNYYTGFQDTVADGRGWKKALADFFGRGETSLTPFYQSFDTWVRSISSPSDLDAILETDASIVSQAQAQVSTGALPKGSIAVDCGSTSTSTSGSSNAPSTGTDTTTKTGTGSTTQIAPTTSGAAIHTHDILIAAMFFALFSVRFVLLEL